MFQLLPCLRCQRTFSLSDQIASDAQLRCPNCGHQSTLAELMERIYSPWQIVEQGSDQPASTSPTPSADSIASVATAAALVTSQIPLAETTDFPEPVQAAATQVTSNADVPEELVIHDTVVVSPEDMPGFMNTVVSPEDQWPSAEDLLQPGSDITAATVVEVMPMDLTIKPDNPDDSHGTLDVNLHQAEVMSEPVPVDPSVEGAAASDAPANEQGATEPPNTHPLSAHVPLHIEQLEPAGTGGEEMMSEEASIAANDDYMSVGGETVRDTVVDHELFLNQAEDSAHPAYQAVPETPPVPAHDPYTLLPNPTVDVGEHDLSGQTVAEAVDLTVHDLGNLTVEDHVAANPAEALTGGADSARQGILDTVDHISPSMFNSAQESTDRPDPQAATVADMAEVDEVEEVDDADSVDLIGVETDAIDLDEPQEDEPSPNEPIAATSYDDAFDDNGMHSGDEPIDHGTLEIAAHQDDVLSDSQKFSERANAGSQMPEDYLRNPNDFDDADDQSSIEEPSGLDSEEAEAQQQREIAAQLTGAGAAAGTASAVAKRARKPQTSGLWSLIQIILGGAAAIPVTLLLLWYVVGIDVANAGPLISQFAPWIVPEKFRALAMTTPKIGSSGPRTDGAGNDSLMPADGNLAPDQTAQPSGEQSTGEQNSNEQPVPAPTGSTTDTSPKPIDPSNDTALTPVPVPESSPVQSASNEKPATENLTPVPTESPSNGASKLVATLSAAKDKIAKWDSFSDKKVAIVELLKDLTVLADSTAELPQGDNSLKIIRNEFRDIGRAITANPDLENWFRQVVRAQFNGLPLSNDGRVILMEVGTLEETSNAWLPQPAAIEMQIPGLPVLEISKEVSMQMQTGQRLLLIGKVRPNPDKAAPKKTLFQAHMVYPL